ncbi:MAG: Sec-independent protein translocase protein TatA [Candidatus Paceibacteria bacterium]|jgi:Sec-independent protein translocase protein TatA
MLALGLLGLGSMELIVMVGLFILFFGSKKIADLAQGVGEAVKILRKSFTEDVNKIDKKN